MITDNKDKDMNKEIAKLLFPDFDNTKDRKYWENKYLNIKRDKNGPVLRLAPSPTGSLHIGTLYLALLNNIITDKEKGTFILRIEDTDTKREQEGSLRDIIKGLSYSGIHIDEGYKLPPMSSLFNTEFEIKIDGNFEPYLQSKRKEIYEAFIYDLIERGYAYPCFMTESELDKMREEQQAMKVRPGCYGKYAIHRDLSLEEIKNKIDKGEKWVVRLKSTGNWEKKIDFVDEFMGELSLSQNDEDFVIYKSDGLPTYHLAHLIDDYLMKVTFVIRGNEWLSSITKHIELWEKLNVHPPKYAHIMPINIKDGDSIRKLSKRKDKEALVEYFAEKGYPNKAILCYLLRLMCPSFDDYFAEIIDTKDRNSPLNLKAKDPHFWWFNNGIYFSNFNKLDADVHDGQTLNLLPCGFDFDINELKRNSRGPLFDFDKLNYFSAEIIAMLSASELKPHYLWWVEAMDKDFYNLIEKDKEYLEKIFNIEREVDNPRKDIYNLSMIKDSIYYFYDGLYNKKKEDIQNDDNNKNKITQKEKIILKELWDKGILNDDKLYLADEGYNLDEWINIFKNFYNNLSDKDAIKFGEIMMSIRKAITNETKTPNLYYIFEVLGKERIMERIKDVL